MLPIRCFTFVHSRLGRLGKMMEPSMMVMVMVMVMLTVQTSALWTWNRPNACDSTPRCPSKGNPSASRNSIFIFAPSKSCVSWKAIGTTAAHHWKAGAWEASRLERLPSHVWGPARRTSKVMSLSKTPLPSHKYWYKRPTNLFGC